MVASTWRLDVQKMTAEQCKQEVAEWMEIGYKYGYYDRIRVIALHARLKELGQYHL